MEKLMEDKEVEEILKEVHVDSRQPMEKNQNNGDSHGQKTNLEQLGPKGLRAQRVITTESYHTQTSKINKILTAKNPLQQEQRKKEKIVIPDVDDKEMVDETPSRRQRVTNIKQ